MTNAVLYQNGNYGVEFDKLEDAEAAALEVGGDVYEGKTLIEALDEFSNSDGVFANGETVTLPDDVGPDVHDLNGNGIPDDQEVPPEANPTPTPADVAKNAKH